MAKCQGLAEEVIKLDLLTKMTQAQSSSKRTGQAIDQFKVICNLLWQRFQKTERYHTFTYILRLCRIMLLLDVLFPDHSFQRRWLGHGP